MFKPTGPKYEQISVFTNKKNPAMDDVIIPDGIKANQDHNTDKIRTSPLQKLINAGWILCKDILPQKGDAVGGLVSVVTNGGVYHTVKHELVKSYWEKAQADGTRVIAWKRITPIVD